MHRCYVEPDNWRTGHVLLSADESHHLTHVLRARPGETVGLFDGQGRQATGVVHEAPPRGRSAREGSVPLVLGIEPGSEKIAVRRTAVCLAPAVIKGPRMDTLVEKAVELGAAVIAPLLTERTVAAGEGSAELRVTRWQRIAVSAAKQCGTPWLPVIGAPCPLATWIAGAGRFDLAVFGALSEGVQPLGQVALSARGSRRAALVVGPEGDLTPAECALLIDHGFIPVSLGDLVLRAETAAIAGLAILSHLLESGHPSR